MPFLPTSWRGPGRNASAAPGRGVRGPGMGAWDFDPMTGEWVETIADFSVTGTSTVPPDAQTVGAPTATGGGTPAIVDPHANDGLPGYSPCDPNGLYPAGHRCAIRQQVTDAQQVIRVVQTAAPRTPNSASAPGDIMATLNRYGAQAATWASQNSVIVAAGLVGLIVFSSFGGRGGGGNAGRRGRR